MCVCVRRHPSLIFLQTILNFEFSERRASKRSGLPENFARSVSVFSQILLKVASVFPGEAKKSVHVYYSDSDHAVAFNQGGCLYFNIYYFLQKHSQAFTDDVDTLAVPWSSW